MSDQILQFSVPPVVKSVTVSCAPDKAFRLFTADLAKWWPLARFHMAAAPLTCVVEPRVGGRIFERASDGTESIWGHVEAWDPPRLVAFTWLVGLAGHEAQRVEVAFAPDGGRTRVVLTHSGWEKLGERATAMRQSYDGGWVAVFEQAFAAYANAA